MDFRPIIGMLALNNNQWLKMLTLRRAIGPKRDSEGKNGLVVSVALETYKI